MTVTIGRRELLAALGGVAAAWPLAPRAQPKLARIGFFCGKQARTRSSSMGVIRFPAFFERNTAGVE